jgi:hypothetical protein
VFFVVIASLVIDLADVDDLEILQKVLPQNEEKSVIFLIVPQSFLVRTRNTIPKLLIAVRGASIPLLFAPGVPDLQKFFRFIEGLDLN